MTEPKLSAAERVIHLLMEHDWHLHGATIAEEARVSTAKSRVYGGIGGELRTFGGRMRFRKANTNLFATVGSKTVSFYHRQDGHNGVEATSFRNYSTSREIDDIAVAVTKDATSEMPRMTDGPIRDDHP